MPRPGIRTVMGRAGVLSVALASGSNGNAVYVETADAKLLFDAGASGRQLEARARSRGIALERIDALVLSHHHSDHVSGAGVIARRYRVPVHATPATWRVAGGRMGPVPTQGRFLPGETLRFGRTCVHTLPTPHDAPGSVAFVVEAGGTRLGILTDLGHPFPRLLDTFATLDGAYLESNHDPGMLCAGPYPRFLQERVAGPGGHLSNEECAGVVEEAASNGLQFVVLSHLSGNCNTPERALERARAIEAGPTVHLAPRDGASLRLVLEA